MAGGSGAAFRRAGKTGILTENGSVCVDTIGAIILLSHEEGRPSRLFSPILFDPACAWLSAALTERGATRFLVLCGDERDRESAAASFPAGTRFVLPEQAGQELAAFVSELSGQVTVITRPVFLLSEGIVMRLHTPSRQTGAFTVESGALRAGLAAGEGLTDILTGHGEEISEERAMPLTEDLRDQASVEQVAKSVSAGRMYASGVRLVDWMNTYIGPQVTVGAGTSILPGTILRGQTVIGRGCELGPYTMIRDCRLGDGVTVNASQLNESTVDDETVVGPYAYVRPNTHVGKGVKVGDFVELKNSTVGDGTKISHLTYVGDTDAGAHINFGCGTVTVNYDGRKKFRTVIGDHAFIGCNTNLVAPVRVGEGAYTAAGSTVTEDVPSGALAIARERQTVKEDWVRRRDEKS